MAGFLDKITPQTTDKQFRKELCRKLATHAGVKFDTAWKEALEYEDQKILHVPSLRPCFQQQYFYCTGVLGVRLMLMMDYKKLLESTIFDQWQIGLGAVPPEKQMHYKMDLRLKNNDGLEPIHFIMYEARAYFGHGGIFTAPNETALGFVFEPLGNWLKRFTPDPV